MKKLILLVFLTFYTLISTPAFASMSDCKNLYVGRFAIENGGLHRFILVANPQDTYGSYWIWTSQLPADEQKMVLSILMTAYSTQTTVTVRTEASGGCSISSGQHNLDWIEYGNTP